MSKQVLHDSVKSEDSFSRCHGGARKGAGRPKKAPLESGKITRLRLFEDTARKWRLLQSAANYSTHDEFASHLLQRYETDSDLTSSADVTHQVKVLSSQLLDNLSKLEMQSNIGSKKRKPGRTIHIDSSGSASLVKGFQKMQSVPRELHHHIQYVRTAVTNLNDELESSFSSSEVIQNQNEEVLYPSGDEEGILAIRTCKSQADVLSSHDTLPNIHVVNIHNPPKTPQQLYYTFNPHCNDHCSDDASDSSASSSSEGFVPSKRSVGLKSYTLSPVTSCVHTNNSNMESRAVTSSELQQSSDDTSLSYNAASLKSLNSPRSRSCSPKVTTQQQRPLKDFSVKVFKLPRSVLDLQRGSSSNVIDYVQSTVNSDRSPEFQESCTYKQVDNLMSSEGIDSSEVNERVVENHEHSGVMSTDANENDLLCEELISHKAKGCNFDDGPRTASDDTDSTDCSQSVLDVPVQDSSHETSGHTMQKLESCGYVSAPCSEHEEGDSKLIHDCSHKSAVKQRGCKIKSEKYVVSSCSEKEGTVTDNLDHATYSSKFKRYSKKQRSSFQERSVGNPKSKQRISSSSEPEDLCTNLSQVEGVKSENDDSYSNMKSAASCSEHEETNLNATKLPKACSNTSFCNHVTTSSTAVSAGEHAVLTVCSPKHYLSPMCSPTQRLSDTQHSPTFLNNHTTSNSSNKSVKRKLIMLDSSETEGQRVTKYKLRSNDASTSKKFPCLSCKGTVNLSTRNFHKHPRFSAFMCNKCWRLYTKGKFTIDNSDGHEEYCCVCGEGGDIVCCDFCNSCACQDCIQRIAGKDHLDALLNSSDEQWKCFSCDNSLLVIYEQFYFRNSVKVDNSKPQDCISRTDFPMDNEEIELLSGSYGSSDVSGIATDEVSMSDTELCNNSEENHSLESNSKASSNNGVSNRIDSSTKRRKRKLVGILLESDDSVDEVGQCDNFTLPSKVEHEVVPPVLPSNDMEHIPNAVNYAVIISCSEEHTSSDSDAIALKKPRSFRKTNIESEGSQRVSHTSSSNESVENSKASSKWYSTRSKVYKGNELDNNSKLSTRKRKRRNIKALSSGSDSTAKSDPIPIIEQLNSGGKKRRKLRKLIDDDKLQLETRKAQKDEELRVKRIKEKERRSKGEENDQFILERAGDINVDVEPTIASYLKPHQREGIKFLWDCCCENLKRMKSSPGSGAILAHCMGLGKSLQVIAFIEALLRNNSTNVNRAAFIVPVNTLENWKNELVKWIPEDKRPRVCYLAMSGSLHGRLRELENWFELGGVLLCGYEMYRNLASGKGKGFNSTTKLAVAKYLLDPGPDIVVCDEGHVLKNPKSALSQSLTKLHTLRRIVLTGTPLQNNLMEYYTMVSFVKPNLLGTQKEFSNRFVNPIKNGQCRDSVASDVREMKYRSHVLHKLLQGCVQRHDYSVLTRELPPKQEYVILFRLSSVQEALYTMYLDKQVDHSNLGRYGNLFTAYQILFKIWNHPWVLRLRDLQKKEEEEGSLKDFVVSGSEDDESSGGCHGSKMNGPSSIANKDGEPSDLIVLSDSDDYESVEQKSAGTNPGVEEASKEWYGNVFTNDMAKMLKLSGKLVFLFALLEKTRNLDEKVLVFSQSLLTLDLIESFLQSDDHGGWCRGLDYLRIDGSTSAECRSYCVDTFNSVDNPKTRLFLISTRAGSLGVNLTAANRVVIFDASWNPTTDLQAIFRTYRYGQTKPVFIYRLLSKGTMEEKIYERQVTKESLSLRVVDEKQIGRHFSQAELCELFEYSPAEQRETPDPALPIPKEDVVLCKLLQKLHPEWITGYHEHDSLLEHRFAEELTPEEQKKAWENYEAKKTETMDYVTRAVLMSQLHQQQNKILATSASTSASTSTMSTQPVAMPYLNQPHPPGSIEQGIENVVQLAFQRCQELTNLRRALSTVEHELAKPGTPVSNVVTLKDIRKKRIDDISRCCNYLQESLNLISVAVRSYVANPSFQANLAAARQVIIDSMHNATRFE